MEHTEAVNQMAAEKYLLGELPPEVRDAFEEHLFDCPECAFDIRAGVHFIDEAKVQLPGLTVSEPEPAAKPAKPAAEGRKPTASRQRDGQSWWRGLFASPAFAGPVFATLLVVLGYQNLVTYPALRLASAEPRLMPSVALHGGTRAGARTTIEADREQGVSLLVDLPDPDGFASFAVDLYDPQGKLAWTRNISAASAAGDSETLSLVIPGRGLQAGTYVLAISGVTSAGQRTEISRHAFDMHLKN